jgi:hypothetical protein
MERYFNIILLNGKSHKLPFEKAFKQGAFIPVGLAANDTRLVMAAMDIGTHGFMEPGTDARPRIIAPSQIKFVEIVITNPSELKIEMP